MAGGNTWQKKLMNKQQAHVRKVQGIKSRWAVDLEVEVKVVKVREFNAPMKSSFTPRPFGWRKAKKACEAGRAVWAGTRAGSSGCYLRW